LQKESAERIATIDGATAAAAAAAAAAALLFSAGAVRDVA